MEITQTEKKKTDWKIALEQPLLWLSAMTGALPAIDHDSFGELHVMEDLPKTDATDTKSQDTQHSDGR